MTYIGIILSAIAVLVIPGIVMMVRSAIRWKGIEDKLDEVVRNLQDLVQDKNRVHAEISEQIREDRSATDRRLRWLEETIWKLHKPNN